MKTLNTILTNKWHLHLTIAAWIMCVLLFLFTFEDTLRELEKHGVCLFILFCGCFVFEWNQDRSLPLGEKQTNKGFWGDIFAGVAGGLFFSIAYALGVPYIALIVVSVLCIGLHIYKTLK